MQTCVIVGAGGRSRMFTEAFSTCFKDKVKLLAVCDNNKGRLKLAYKKFKTTNPNLAIYHAEDFDKMLTEHKPDRVIATTKDSAHDEYICRALQAGCDVITEKPMTIDQKRCQRIINTVKETGRKVLVTFNYRYAPPRSQVKQLLVSGVIGRILSVEFKWLLDTNHGADYFRRWHRSKVNSGGLIVHKATHHFDLVNWWISDIPEVVFAKGDRVFYNEQQAKRYGLENHGIRCLDCPVNNSCNFYLDMRAFEIMQELYLDNEQYDGYFRDRCVFSDEIDIEDSMNVIVKYKTGALLSYSLNAFSPWEGYQVAFNGTKGRLEHTCQESSYIHGDGTVQGALKPQGTSIKIYPHFKTPYSVTVNKGKGSHGGGDILMLNDIFDPPDKPDPLKRAADYVQGAYSISIGIAANKSMATGRQIYIAQLISGLPEPDFPDMPTGDERIPYVADAERYSGGKKAEANVPRKLEFDK